MEVSCGCVVQVTTKQGNKDGSYVIAEALTFVPGVKICNDINDGRKLVSIFKHFFRLLNLRKI